MPCNCTPQNHRSAWVYNEEEWNDDIVPHDDCDEEHDWHCEYCQNNGNGYMLETMECGCCSDYVMCVHCDGTGVGTH